MIVAFVLINTTPERTAALAGELADVGSVAEVYSTAGAYDLVAIVRVRHHEELADVVTGAIATLAGISHTHTLVAFRSYSRTDVDALWSIGSESSSPGAADASPGS